MTPPVDLDKPVSNPELVAQMIRARQTRTPEALQRTLADAAKWGLPHGAQIAWMYANTRAPG